MKEKNNMLKNELSGTLSSIRFKSDDTSFIIGSLKASELNFEPVSILGNVFQPEIGLDYKLRGKWSEHPKYGKQFEFYHHEILKPKNTMGMYRYLIRICKWIGPSVANQIVDLYKNKTLDILKDHPERVANQIKGITIERAFEIQEALKENEIIEACLIELEGIFSKIDGIPKSIPIQLIQEYKTDAVTQLKDNPYKVLTDIKGVGFPTADKVALTSLSYDKKSPARERAATFHVINQNMQADGSLWISMSDVCERVKGLTGLSGLDGIFKLIKSKVIVEKNAFYALVGADRAESYIAGKLVMMVGE